MSDFSVRVRRPEDLGAEPNFIYVITRPDTAHLGTVTFHGVDLTVEYTTGAAQQTTEDEIDSGIKVATHTGTTEVTIEVELDGKPRRPRLVAIIVGSGG